MSAPALRDYYSPVYVLQAYDGVMDRAIVRVSCVRVPVEVTHDAEGLLAVDIAWARCDHYVAHGRTAEEACADLRTSMLQDPGVDVAMMPRKPLPLHAYALPVRNDVLALIHADYPGLDEESKGCGTSAPVP